MTVKVRVLSRIPYPSSEALHFASTAAAKSSPSTGGKLWLIALETLWT